MTFAMTYASLLVRVLRYRKPVESGLLWSLATAFMGLQAGGAGKIGSAYFATAGLNSGLLPDRKLLRDGLPGRAHRFARAARFQ